MPTQNFIYADVEGHIGYTLGGALPIRAPGDGLLPVPGWTGEHEWAGMIPRDELPHVLDPDEGFVASANTQIAGVGYPYALPGEYLARLPRHAHPPADRANAASTTRHSFSAIQGDQRSLPGLELAALAGRLAASNADRSAGA